MNRNKRKTKQGNKRRTSGKSLGIIRVMPVNTRRKIPATLTEEQEWQTDVPNIKLSRAFLIFLMLHIVAVAGILMFNLMKGDEIEAAASSADPAASSNAEPAKTQLTSNPRPAAASPWLEDGNVTRVDLTSPTYRGLRQHVVRSGDSLKDIAALHSVSERELAALNKITEHDLLRISQLLVIPARKLNPSLPDELRAMEPPAPAPDPARPATIAIPGSVTPPEPAPKPARKIVEKPAPKPEKAPVITSVPPRPKVAERSVPVAKPAPDPAKVASTPPKPAPANVVKPKSAPKPAPDPAPADAKKSGSVKTYTMKRGDNPFRVAKKYGIDYRELLRFNGIPMSKAGNLPVGRVLKIPAK